MKIKIKNIIYKLSKKYILNLKKRLLKYRYIDLESKCWIWTKRCTPNGYGQICIYPKPKTQTNMHVHRISAAIFLNFDLISNLCICHHCDNKKCFNPNHLFIGTQKDNMQDSAKKGHTLRGIKNWNAKLSEEIVLKIRNEGAQNNWKLGTNIKLAKKYNVDPRTISYIKNRKTWKHI